VALPHPHPEILHHETPDIGSLLDLFAGGFTGSVSGLGPRSIAGKRSRRNSSLG